MCGVDFTRIDGIDVTTALVVVSETGADLGRLPGDKPVASWLGLCPGTARLEDRPGYANLVLGDLPSEVHHLDEGIRQSNRHIRHRVMERRMLCFGA